MTPAEIRANLTAEQWKAYQRFMLYENEYPDSIGFVEAHAEANRLLRKCDKELKRMGFIVYKQKKVQSIRSEIATALKGVGE